LTIVTFKNVGQGDSIIVEWEDNGKTILGIIDCKLYEKKNPIVEHLSQKNISEIEFVILTHCHLDHLSGMPGLFNYCYDNGIKIKKFLHTISDHVFHIYNKIFTSKKVEKAFIDFIDSLALADKNILIDAPVNFTSVPIQLSDSLTLSFFAPSPRIGTTIAKQIKRKINKKEFKYSDINKLAIITYIQSNESGILLTSDAVKACFRYLYPRINKKIELIQAPHHGSYNNIYIDFWQKLQKKGNCPVVFSVGYEPKDELPDKETVEFLDKSGFDVYSTNNVFGINEYFNQISQTPSSLSNYSKSQYLNIFSKSRNSTYGYSRINSKYEGDQQFTVFQ